MFKSKALLSLTAAALSGLAASPAHANDPDLRATTVPATACHPVRPAATAPIELSLTELGWVFSGSDVGTVLLYCPLPVNNNTVFDMTNDNDMTTYRVLYTDTDGMGAAAEVRVWLMFRGVNASVQVPGSVWSSNSSNVMVANQGFQFVGHDLQPALYSVVVRLTRTTDLERPVFRGIDFQ
jgi:hypothetical protein